MPPRPSTFMPGFMRHQWMLALSLAACRKSDAVATQEKIAEVVAAPQRPEHVLAPQAARPPKAVTDSAAIHSDGSPPPLDGGALTGPPRFTIQALDCTGATVFAAGFTAGFSAPDVWVGRLDPRARSVTWTQKIAIPNHGGHETEYKVWLSADRDAHGARFALSGWDEFAAGGGVNVFERVHDRWVESGRMEPPSGEQDLGFGRPLLLRGAEIFTVELAGSRGGSVYHYQRVSGAWSRAKLPMGPAVAMPWWHLAKSESSDALGLTSMHGDDHYFLELYVRSPDGRFVPQQALPLPRPPAALDSVGGRFVVGLQEPNEAGASLLVVALGPSGWEIEGSVTLPPSGPRSVGNLALGSERAVVWRGEPWLVDLATLSVTHRLLVPEEGAATSRYPGPALASCDNAFVASAGANLILFWLPSGTP